MFNRKQEKDATFLLALKTADSQMCCYMVFSTHFCCKSSAKDGKDEKVESLLLR
jgi:hypothetical protein